MSLSAPASQTRWGVPEDLNLVGGHLTWPRNGSVRPAELPGPAFPILDRFARLVSADDQEVLAFARKWGPLHLCRHGLPASHLPRRVWRFATEVTGAFEDDAADNYRPCGAPGLRRLREPLARWRQFAGEAQAILNVAASLHRENRAPIEMWAPLEERFGAPAVVMLGEQNAEAGLIEPPPQVLSEDVQGVSPRRSTIDEQRRLVSRAVQEWLELGDVAVIFRWTGAASIEFGSYCLFGALALQLALAVARSQGLAVCMSCGRAYPPLRQPAPGRNNYCDLSDCGSRAAKRDWARRKVLGSAG